MLLTVQQSLQLKLFLNLYNVYWSYPIHPVLPPAHHPPRAPPISFPTPCSLFSITVIKGPRVWPSLDTATSFKVPTLKSPEMKHQRYLCPGFKDLMVPPPTPQINKGRVKEKEKVVRKREIMGKYRKWGRRGHLQGLGHHSMGEQLQSLWLDISMASNDSPPRH